MTLLDASSGAQRIFRRIHAVIDKLLYRSRRRVNASIRGSVVNVHVIAILNDAVAEYDVRHVADSFDAFRSN